MIDVGERRKCRRHPEDRRHAPFAVPAIPMLPMSLAHGWNTMRRRATTRIRLDSAAWQRARRLPKSLNRQATSCRVRCTPSLAAT